MLYCLPSSPSRAPPLPSSARLGQQQHVSWCEVMAANEWKKAEEGNSAQQGKTAQVVEGLLGQLFVLESKGKRYKQWNKRLFLADHTRTEK